MKTKTRPRGTSPPRGTSSPKRLWLLRPKDDSKPPWTDKKGDSEYDMAQGFVVRAATEYAARELAADKHGDEQALVWLLEEMTTCTKLTKRGPSEIILRDYLPG